MAFAGILLAPSSVLAATLSLVGTELSLKTEAQATPTSQLFVTSFPASVTVSETSVEFPDVASLFDPTVGVPPGFASSLVDVAIDVGADFLTIDFTNSAPFSLFATGFKNTYVFTFASSVALNITDAIIDTNVTTLGLTDGRVTFSGNELFVNVQSLPFDTSTFVRINLTSEEAVAAVPLPAGLPLLLSGLLGIGLQARRKKAA
ncbi:VPLPA-CTERM sorting domain-containing protein [Rhodovulum sulfidophilum]|nr:VPLPA-CTERM sorting domain-containing protein [Rhodovulum sulfidophilum]